MHKRTRIPIAVEDVKSSADALWSNVDKSGECWLWTGTVDTNGYGRVYIHSVGRAIGAHRVSWLLAGEMLRYREILDHICHERRCCNPQHLRLSTTKLNAENLRGAQKRNITGVRGVSWHAGRRKYRAHVRHNGSQVHVGWFVGLQEAERAVVETRNRLFTHNDRDRSVASSAP